MTTAAPAAPGPARVQRRRTKGWRKPDGAVIVDRTSRWGNPFPARGSFAQALAEALGLPGDDAGRREAVKRMHRAWLLDEPLAIGSAGRIVARMAARLDVPDPPSLADIRRDLAGRDLCCSCPLPAPGEPDRCHRDTLIELANAGAGP